MKKIYRILCMIAIASIAIVGCDKIDELNTVTFEPTFSTDLECTVPTSGKSPLIHTFSASGVIDPQDDADVKKYLSKIKGYEVKSITGTITSISPNNANLVTGSVVIKNSQYTAQWAVQNLPLQVGQKLTLGNDMGEWDTVSKILKDGQKITVMASGETDKGGIVFIIAIEIKAKATAKAI
jgi:hypothetical protein